MIAMANITTNTLYDQMKGYLDMPEFIDYMLLHFFIGHRMGCDKKLVCDPAPRQRHQRDAGEISIHSMG
jgi:hypothetical protein